MSTPRPGDYFVTRTNGILAAAVRYGTSSTVNHAGIYVGHVDGYTEPQVVEARPGGAGYRNVSAYRDAIWSTGRLPVADQPDDTQRAAIVFAAKKTLGTPYGIGDIVAIALAQKRLGSRITVSRAEYDQPWWVRRLMRPDRLICSQLVDVCMAAAGIHLFQGTLPGLVSPGDLLSILLPVSAAA